MVSGDRVPCRDSPTADRAASHEPKNRAIVLRVGVRAQDCARQLSYDVAVYGGPTSRAHVVSVAMYLPRFAVDDGDEIGSVSGAR
jgi:hypothetical protein